MTAWQRHIARADLFRQCFRWAHWKEGSVGASLNEPPPKLQQLVLNFLATFFSGHLTYRTTISARPALKIVTIRNFYEAPEHTWGPSDRVGGTGGPDHRLWRKASNFKADGSNGTLRSARRHSNGLGRKNVWNCEAKPDIVWANRACHVFPLATIYCVPSRWPSGCGVIIVAGYRRKTRK